MIFRLYILYNKHKMIKIGTQNREISQVLSQVLEYFFGGVYLMLVINSIKPKDHDLTNIYFIKLQ